MFFVIVLYLLVILFVDAAKITAADFRPNANCVLLPTIHAIGSVFIRLSQIIIIKNIVFLSKFK